MKEFKDIDKGKYSQWALTCNANDKNATKETYIDFETKLSDNLTIEEAGYEYCKDGRLHVHYYLVLDKEVNKFYMLNLINKVIGRPAGWSINFCPITYGDGWSNYLNKVGQFAETDSTQLNKKRKRKRKRKRKMRYFPVPEDNEIQLELMHSNAPKCTLKCAVL